MKKPSPTFWLIDDYANLREMHKDAILKAFAGSSVYEFPDLFRAKQAVGNPDFIIIDMSAVAPISLTGRHLSSSPIASLCEAYPGATIIICSAVDAVFANAVIEDVREVVENADIRYRDLRDGNWGLVEEIKDALH